jgi:GTP-binding protein Era
MKTIVAETVREKVLRNTKEEVPHSVAVVIDYFHEKDDLSEISASVYVEADSQKGIIIGDKGSMLKKIGSEARKDIETLLEGKVFLDLHVKVRKKWRKDASALKKFGYVQ